MLYDILFIDDSFDGGISESGNSELWDIDARKLFLELVRDNLRVTYTTGELKDLEKLARKDLSCIKYVFCDLHLEGIKESDSYQKISSKLLGIFGKLWEDIDSQEVTIFINSQYIEKHGEEVKINLEKTIKEKSKPPNILSIKNIEKKNNLSEDDRKELLRNHLEIHLKSLIISKALEIETIFDKKLKIDDNFVDVIRFEDKFKKFKEKFKLEKSEKNEIKLLQQIRNKVAHTDNALGEIKDNGVRKQFWNIIEEGSDSHEEIIFNTFPDLIKYIDSIDKLEKIISDANENNTP